MGPRWTRKKAAKTKTLKQPKSGLKLRPYGDFTKTLVKFFNDQRAYVTRVLLVRQGKAFIKTRDSVLAPIDLSQWDKELQKRVGPFVEFYANDAIKQTGARLGISDSFQVPPPRIKEGVDSLSLKFAASTNATTTKKLDVALETLRADLLAGIVGDNDTPAHLSRIVKDVFDNAADSRAISIALSESSRAQHFGQRLAAEASGVVKGFKWLLSSDPCKFCIDIEHRYRNGITLNGDFGLASSYDSSGAKAGNPYDQMQHPPAHTDCKCTLLEQIDEEALRSGTETQPAISATGDVQVAPTAPSIPVPLPLPDVIPTTATTAPVAPLSTTYVPEATDISATVRESFVNLKVRGVESADSEIISGINESLENMAHKFPSATKKLKVIDLASNAKDHNVDATTIASFDPEFVRIDLFKNKSKKLNASVKRSRKQKWLLDNGTPNGAKAIFDHEFGHYIDSFGSYDNVDDVVAFKNALRKFIGDNKPTASDLSKYGLKNKSESFAEAFASLIGDKAKRTPYVNRMASFILDEMKKANYAGFDWLI